jgi:hypothetical protein
MLFKVEFEGRVLATGNTWVKEVLIEAENTAEAVKKAVDELDEGLKQFVVTGELLLIAHVHEQTVN